MKKALSLGLLALMMTGSAFGASLRVPDTTGKIREYTITGSSIKNGVLSIQGDAVERRKSNERETEYFHVNQELLAKDRIDSVSLMNLITYSGANVSIYCDMKNFTLDADVTFNCDSILISSIAKR
ncbi:hypothetical protein D3C87_88830 [compost metagenome]